MSTGYARLDAAEDYVDTGKDSLAQRAMRRGNQALTIAIIALFIGICATAFALVYGLINNNNASGLQTQLTDAQGNLTEQQTQIQLLFSEMSEVLLNVTSADFLNVTLASQGTFIWTFGTNDDGGGRATYLVHNVQVGPLNFNTLTLPGPINGWPMTVAAGTNVFYMRDFQPPLSMLNSISYPSLPSGMYVMPLTSTNAKKMLVSGARDCFDDQTCYETGIVSDTVPLSPNTLVTRVLSGDPADPSNYILGGEMHGPGIEGRSFALESPWVLVLPTS